MLQVLLSSHSQVATTVELTTFNRYVAPWLKAWREEVENTRLREFHQGLHYIWEEAEFIGWLREFLGATYGRVLARKPGATHVLDKQPAYSLHVDAIKRLIPQARFLHIVRDGRDVAASLVAAYKTRGFGKRTIHDAAAHWRGMLLSAREAAKYGPDYLEVRYEDFLSEGSKAYGAVLDFCRLPYERQWLDETMAANTFEKMKAERRSGDPTVQSSAAHYRKGGAGNWREDLSFVEGYEFENAAGELLRSLHYESRADWWRRSPLDGVFAPLASAAGKYLRR